MIASLRSRRWPALAAALLALSAPAHAATFQGVVTHVTDGDSIWVRPDAGGAPRELRIHGIDAPEICQRFGDQSRRALAAQVLHRPVTVKSRAQDSYQRTLAKVSAGGQDVGGWMVRNGHAWSYRFRGKGGPYMAEETSARNARLGLWNDAELVNPRQFRKQHGSCF
jgi:micrococcal nuclease